VHTYNGASNKISKLYIKLLKIEHEIDKYTSTIYNYKQYMKLLYKICVKLYRMKLMK